MVAGYVYVRLRVTPDDARTVIRESIARGSSTPTLREPRELYLSEQSERLINCVIPPALAVVVGETFHHGVYDQLRTEQVFAVARADDRWLLYRPTKRQFALAYGPNLSELTIWGFSSSDALAEWLG